MTDPNATASFRAAAKRRLEDEIGADLGDDELWQEMMKAGPVDSIQLVKMDHRGHREPFASSVLDPARSVSISRLGASVKDLVTSKTSTKAATDEDAEYLGRTSSEWFWMMFEAILAVWLIVIAFATWSDCDVIPSLSANVALAGIFDLLLAAVAFAWRVERLRENGDVRAPDGYIASPALAVHDFLSVAVVAVAIWGAVLTFGDWPMMGMGGEGQCNSALYITAFASSVITLSFALYYIGEECWEKAVGDEDSEASAPDDEAV